MNHEVHQQMTQGSAGQGPRGMRKTRNESLVPGLAVFMENDEQYACGRSHPQNDDDP